MPRFDSACRANRHKVIRNEKRFLTKLHYIHKNPVEAGVANLPEEYKYASARNYIIKVDRSFAGTEIR